MVAVSVMIIKAEVELCFEVALLVRFICFCFFGAVDKRARTDGGIVATAAAGEAHTKNPNSSEGEDDDDELAAQE